MYNFRRAFQYADAFRAFVAEVAESTALTDRNGLPRSAVGMTIGELIETTQCFSETPLELITVCRLKPMRLSSKSDGEFGATVTVKKLDFDLKRRIERHDWLVFLPTL